MAKIIFVQKFLYEFMGVMQLSSILKSANHQCKLYVLGEEKNVIKKVKMEKPDLNVLILSMHSEEQYAVRVFKAGASGYLTKDKAPDELIAALQKVSEGGKYVSSTLAEKLAFDLSVSSEKPLHENLSDREFQVLCEIASGKTVKQIAQNMCLSVKTISTYRSRILSKMAMKSNAELTYYAIKHGLVD